MGGLQERGGGGGGTKKQVEGRAFFNTLSTALQRELAVELVYLTFV